MHSVKPMHRQSAVMLRLGTMLELAHSSLKLSQNSSEGAKWLILIFLSIPKSGVFQSSGRTEELNRLLDPQPRVTRSGARFKASTSLIRKEGEVRENLELAPQNSNTQHDAAKSAKKKTPDTASRQQASGAAPTPALPGTPGIGQVMSDFATKQSTAKSRAALRQETLDSLVPENAQKKIEAPTPGKVQSTETQVGAPAISSEEDEEISQAIEAAIKARLKKIGGATGGEQSGAIGGGELDSERTIR